ncbi:transcriptional regulator GcvA [Rhizobiales bacterium]|uniref:transcriptional regulator GcvA n=1 Tax=Hongsoonwoonella zoysiae TaxID=2821844 RepID=UPI001560B68F|nr:transcriptional regulator GcvA [Hongsoonwoonella zoysiae]NRG19457.1 transcriptional regulator GcvA [Hongsoonwoonella zoysiae]
MTSSPPPLAALRAFEAAARHQSFTRAGEELGMTQAAVSYQIKVLEDRLGAPLFFRRPRQVTLTETGQRLAPEISRAFAILADAFTEARGIVEGTLTISTMQTFAAHWLVQRLGAFQLQNPSLAVRLDPSADLVDFSRDSVDVAIRSGNGKWPGLKAHLIMKADFTPMLSPELAERHGGVNSPEDLLRLPLLDPSDPWWPKWFAKVGINAEEELSRLRGSYYTVQTLEAGAAMAGAGVAILTPAFYKAELASRRLLQPFDLVAEDGRGYWLVYPENRGNSPKIRAFRDWILAEEEASAD